MLAIGLLLMAAAVPRPSGAAAAKTKGGAPAVVEAGLQQLINGLDRSESLRLSRMANPDGLAFRLVSQKRALVQISQKGVTQQAAVVFARRQGTGLVVASAQALPLDLVTGLLADLGKAAALNRASYELDLQSAPARQAVRELGSWLQAHPPLPATAQQLEMLRAHPGIEFLVLSGAGQLDRLWLVPDNVQIDIRYSGNPTSASTAAAGIPSQPPKVSYKREADGSTSITFEIQPDP